MRPRDILSANLDDLMARLPVPTDQRRKVLRDTSKIPNGTLGRIVNAEVDAGIDKLELLAAALGVEPWELLVPPEKRESMRALAAALRAASAPQQVPAVAAIRKRSAAG
ncbi:MAG: hypothetical protein ACK5QX_01965 [bacterium]|jgi:hypothetical protein